MTNRPSNREPRAWPRTRAGGGRRRHGGLPGPGAAPAAATAQAAAARRRRRSGEAAREKLIARAKSLELPTPYEPRARRRALAPHLGLREDGVLGGVPHRLRPSSSPPNTWATSPGPTNIGRRWASRSWTWRRRRSASRCRTASCARRSTPTARAASPIPRAASTLNFTPKAVKPNLPAAAAQDWPMGDRLPKAPLPAGVDEAKVQGRGGGGLRDRPRPRRRRSS